MLRGGSTSGGRLRRFGAEPSSMVHAGSKKSSARSLRPFCNPTPQIGHAFLDMREQEEMICAGNDCGLNRRTLASDALYAALEISRGDKWLLPTCEKAWPQVRSKSIH